MDVGFEACRCCKGKTELLSVSKILSYDGNYTICKGCKSVQVDSPHWLQEAHTNAISQFDTGLVSRCTSASRILGSFLLLQRDPIIVGLDWGGGTGLLTRLLRDLGFETFSYDKYAVGDLAHGFTLTEKEIHQEATFISAIECFEHLQDPIETFSPLVTNKKYFIFTTEVLPSPLPNPSGSDWWYFMPESGQHVTFASSTGLIEFQKILGFSNYLNLGNIHIYSRQKFNARTIIVMKFRILRWIHTRMILPLSRQKHSLAVRDRDLLLSRSVI
jgi:hypothetical protein